MPRSWPALIIGIVVSIYWTRVVQMVLQARRTAGHDANFVPREKLGRLLRLVWIPVVTLWIILPLAQAIRKKHEWVFRSLYGSPPVTWSWAVAWIAALIAVAALIVTFICWAKMGTSWRMGINPDDKTQLISTGPYAYVRHPIYALSSVLVIMTMLVIPSPAMLLVGGMHLLLLQWEARREENYLLSVHGDDYRVYSQHTGRFMPRLTGH